MLAMASFEHKVQSSLQCPVCLELLTEPKQLSCTHTFCKKCLNNILKCSSQNTANTLTCPICRSTTDVRGGNVINLMTNVPLKSLIDDVRNSQQLCEICATNVKALHFCCECGKNLCNTCLENHNKWPPHLKHRVVSVEDIREGRVVLKKKVFCQEHKSDGQEHVCTDVCITCKKFICLRCMIYHEKKGHTVQSTEEYDASVKTGIESLQAQAKTKTTTVKKHVTCIKTQKKRINDHIASKKAEINQLYQESMKKLKKRKAELDKQLETRKAKLCKKLDEMKDADERLIASIESVGVLAGNSLKAPLEGHSIVIRDSLSGELKNVLDRDDPEKKLATDVADRAEQLIFTPNHQGDQLNIGEVRFVKCELKCDVELSKKDSMNAIVATPDGRMAVGSRFGGIDIFSADGQLQQTVLKDVWIGALGFLTDGRYVVINESDGATLYTQECEMLDVKFEILSIDDGGTCSLTIDSNDMIYVSYRKPKKIQVFSPAGGKAIREIPCDGYEPQQITSYNDLLIISYFGTVIMVDKEGNVKHKVKGYGNAFYAVTQSNSILIAWVKHRDGLVSIDEYTNDLKHIQTLISDHKIEENERGWYYLQVFRSGEIAFCAPDRLYIFKLTITPVSG